MHPVRYRINYHDAVHVHKYTMRDSKPKDYNIYSINPRAWIELCMYHVFPHTGTREPVMAETI